MSNKIIFVSASRGVWGAEESLLTLASALKENGQLVELVCYDGRLGRAWAKRLGSGLHQVGSGPAKQNRLQENLRLWRRAVKIGDSEDRYVIFTYYLVLAAPILRLLRRAVFLDMHDYLARPRARLTLRWCARACRGIVAVSRFVASQFGEQHVAVLTRPVIALDPVVRPTGELHAKNIGLIGRVVPDKGHALLVSAVAMIRTPPTLNIVFRGDDTLEPQFASMVLAEGRRRLGGRVRHDGQVDRELVLSDLDVLVVANPAEPMGRTVLEAQLSGVVAVVPSSGGSAELVEDGSTGYIYRAGDASSLAAALVRAVSNDGREMLGTAQQVAQTVTDPAAYAASYIAAMQPRGDREVR